MKNLNVILLFILISKFSFGQDDLGVKLNFGLSKVSASLKNKNVETNTERYSNFSLSGHTGFFYSLNFKNKSRLGIELLFLQIEGNEGIDFDLFDINRNVIGHANSNFRSHTSYLSLPLYYGIDINKFSVNIGGQVSLLLSGHGEEYTRIEYDGKTTIREIDHEDLYIDKYDFGARIGGIFYLNDKYAIEGTYYYGLNNLIDGKNLTWSKKNQQLSLGIRYIIKN